jgi:hypothetical protein
VAAGVSPPDKEGATTWFFQGGKSARMKLVREHQVTDFLLLNYTVSMGSSYMTACLNQLTE